MINGSKPFDLSSTNFDPEAWHSENANKYFKLLIHLRIVT